MPLTSWTSPEVVMTLMAAIALFIALANLQATATGNVNAQIEGLRNDIRGVNARLDGISTRIDGI